MQKMTSSINHQFPNSVSRIQEYAINIHKKFNEFPNFVFKNSGICKK